jgi:ectoine hydroxylase-related dioxygenase (phytanoyl-CoA dioxygenase family)
MDARRLSIKELDHYQAQGYMIYGSILTPDELGLLRAQVDNLLHHLPVGQRPENVEAPHVGRDYFRRVAAHPRFLDVVEQIVGPNVVLFGSTIIAKPGGDGKAVAWHQDTPYWPLSPMRAVTLWLAVDDSTRENGCMRVIPGSHRQGHIAHETVDPQAFVLSLGARESDVDEAAAVDLELRAGECSLHDPGILHGSKPNTSAIRRCGYVLHYTAAEASLDRSRSRWDQYPLYLLRGADPQGHNRYANAP